MVATATRPHVILVRPWVDAHAGGGCCSAGGRDAIGLDDGASLPVEHDHATRVMAAAYQRLREELPDVDVQIVSASNTLYLVPAVLRAAGRGDGVRARMRRANQATRPGSLLLDGAYVGDVHDLGPGGVVEAVRSRLGSSCP